MAEAPHSEVAVWFTPALAAASALLGAFGLWLANRMLGKAAFQTAINDGFAKLTAAQERANTDLEGKLTAERVKSAGIEAQLRGEIINLTQVIEGLKNILRDHGIPVPSGYTPPVDFITLPKSEAPHDKR